MNLTRGCAFVLGEQHYRLCYLNGDTRAAAAIRVDATSLDFHWFSYDDLERAERVQPTKPSRPTEPKADWLRKAEINLAHVKPLLDLGCDIVDRDIRSAKIEHLTREGSGRCARSLSNLLLRYFTRGMNLYALLPDYANCGRTAIIGETAGRGARNAYQVTRRDLANFEQGKDYWLGDQRRTQEEAFRWVRDNCYTYTDGNGSVCLLPAQERPTIHQFRRYLNREVPIELRVRKRHGEKAFRRDAKPTLSATIQDCLGVGHIYEIDATIGDVLIVSKADRLTVIGKATLYLIVDRRSRLIVGLYVGLESPCWEAAVEAICSLTEDKEKLCQRYGIPYDPADWPADGLLPALILGDNAEMKSVYSTAIAKRLETEIANTESYLPTHKPNVETRFKLLTVILRARAPGYVPPEDFAKRCRKGYEKEACLTLDEFIAEVLTAIIQYNRSPIVAEEVRDPGQILRGVTPSPIGLWNDGVLNGGGCMGHEMAPQDVRLALLPRGTASITGDGILFNNLYYETEHAALYAAMVKARNTQRRVPVEVSHDRRSVDMIWVHCGGASREIAPVFLSPRSIDYAGMSFRETATIRQRAKSQKPDHREKRDQAAFEAGQRSAENIRRAESLRDDLGTTSSRSRTRNTTSQRAEERHAANRDAAAQQREKVEGMQDSRTPDPPTDNVVGLPVRNRLKSRDPSKMSAAQKARMQEDVA